MKRPVLYIAAIITLLISFSACEKYLDLEPQYTQDAENFFENPSDYERALIGAYDLLQSAFLTSWIGEIASDNSIAGGESVTDTEGLHEIDEMRHDAVNTELRNIFRWNYAGVTRANYILEHRDNIDFEGKETILAEASFLRAYYYFELVKYFGAVPLVVDRRLGATEVTEVDRAPVSEVYAQIEADLQYASEILDWTNPVKGRVTKGAALSLLGKAYLYQDKFDLAAQTLDRVINEGPYSLFGDYAGLWTVDNENNSETVFDVEYSGLEGGGYGCLICLEGNAAPGFNGIRQYEGPIYGDGNSYNLPTQDLYDFFPSTDPRRDITVLDIEAFIAAQPNPAAITYAEGGGGHTGFYNNKYIKRKAELGLPDNDLTSPLNYKAIRYADVLLMAAEAHNRKPAANDAQALIYVNMVRDRVNVTPIASGGSQLTQDIWKERRLELSGEGLRFFDLVRTGEAANEIDGFVSNKHELFPIPQVEIDLAGGNWNQNPNY
ncbi:MAG TPA: RagB/SusD family nutrient uptake outer membrane protein [Cryomorphaceae bacterium]|nr:RagB/SusD family nutrient uptake outer membrane protein [Owenweeksia sp.]HAD97909.1 RagB/SusD family nutrient uptake outer membrane protein [Cryomorphaceae bacterium]HBF19763.1 RagB/SusD family nutrient uptake outer membrane protein [Cryomorphaceae bacterium]HCQ15081.1 RagB/SusD family nutrient uptake outer membrane protein [Cryomorphaceae bacterium]